MAVKRSLFCMFLWCCSFLFVAATLSAQPVTFTDIGATAGVNSGSKSNGVAFGDYNNDGFVDIFVCRSRGSSGLLFKNKGDNTFANATVEAGLADLIDMAMPLWADFDNDGDQDLFIISFSRGNFLFQNNGDGTFVNISETAGVALASKGVATASADVDNDGFLDIYIANFSDENILYRNNGDMTFTDIIQQSGALDRGYAMGIAFCDYDNDGDQDLLLSHDGDAGNILYQNDGAGVFTD
ncbi:MAG: FG-GAP repeat domain-containing protein, partial [bacterium]